jgi:hypothetical protein
MSRLPFRIAFFTSPLARVMRISRGAGLGAVEDGVAMPESAEQLWTITVILRKAPTAYRWERTTGSGASGQNRGRLPQNGAVVRIRITTLLEGVLRIPALALVCHFEGGATPHDRLARIRRAD